MSALLISPTFAQTITHVTLFTFDEWSVSSSAGDVNGDGFDDLIVGDAGADNNGRSSGRARVFSGIDGSVLHTFVGDSGGEFFGGSVSGAGDVNGDGFADLIVGATGHSSNGARGTARVFSGIDGSVLYTFVGDSDGDRLGGSVSGAGDVNGDGFDDLIVGAIGHSDNGFFSGSARVFSGVDGSVLFNFVGDAAEDLFGESVSGAGDVNGDGFDDLIIGASGNDNNGEDSGSARVFSGIDGNLLYNFDGDAAGDRLGGSVSGAGDVNGDGFADLIIGAAGDSNNGDGSGSARVFSGINGSVLYSFEGDSALDSFGRAVSGAGDVNGDGFDDLIVGADRHDRNLAGIARVFSGVDGNVLYSFVGESIGDSFGRAVSGAGDVNGDGVTDFIVGGSNGARLFVSQTTILGDCNLDGEVTFLDINPLIAILTRGSYLKEADCNQDDVVNFLDIAPFIETLTGN